MKALPVIIGVIALVLFSASPAHAVVVEGAAIAIALGGALGVSAATAAAIINAAIAVAFSVGSYLIQGALAGNTGGGARPFGSTSTERQSTSTTPVRPLFFYMGEVKLGGHQIFSQVNSSGRLVRVLVFNCEPVQEVQQHFINNEPVLLDDDGWVQEPTKWLNKIRITTYAGDPDQTSPQELQDSFDAWTADHRGRNLAYVVIEQVPTSIATVNQSFPRGAAGEEWTALIKSSKSIYDPRDQSAAYSENAVLALLHVLLHEYGGNLSLSDLSLQTWEDAADAADILDVSVDGSDVARYRAAGVFEASKADEAVSTLITTVNDLLTNCNGSLFEDPDNDGKLGIRLDRPNVNSDAPFKSSEILSVQDSPAQTLLQKRDATSATFVHPESGYAENTTPHYPSSVASPQNIQSLSLPFCPDWSQAGRIVKFKHLEAVAESTISISMTSIGHVIQPGDVVTFDAFEIETGSYMVDTVESGGTAQPSFLVSLFSLDDDYGVWNAETEMEEPNLPEAMTADGQTVGAPSNFCVGSISGAGDIRMIWEGSTSSDGLAIEVEWSETGLDDFGNRERIFPASAGTATISSTQEAVGNIDIRVRFLKLTGGVTDWSVLTNESTTVAKSAPTAPTTSLLPTTHDIATQGASINLNGRYTWTAGQCVYLSRIFIEKNVNPPTSLLGSDVFGTDTYRALPIQTLVTGIVGGDLIHIQIEIENVSGATTKSAVHTITVSDSGGGGE